MNSSSFTKRDYEWISNYIHVKQWDVITHPSANFKIDLIKLSQLKGMDEWLHHINHGCDYLFMPQSELNHVSKKDLWQACTITIIVDILVPN